MQTCVATLVADTVASEARLLDGRPLRRAWTNSSMVSLRQPTAPVHVVDVDTGPRPRGPQPNQSPARGSPSDPEDLGVVAIPDFMVPPGIIPATLPAASALATLRVDDPLTVVGFGCERLAQNRGPHNLRCGTFTRRYTTTPFQALRPAMLALNANTAAGAQGGACFADSWRPGVPPGRRASASRSSRPSAAATHSAMQSGASTAPDTPAALA